MLKGPVGRIDTVRGRATPEGVSLNLRVAGPPIRLLAWIVDVLIMTAAQSVVAVVVGVLGDLGAGILMLSVFAITWFYPVGFEVLHAGATPGKVAFGLQVVHDDGTPVGLGASLLRNLLRFADFLPVAYGAGLVSMLLSPDFKRLGDLAAGTLVVYRENAAADREVPFAPPMPPPVALDLREQRAVIDFGARLDTWSEARRAELAEIVEPLAGARGEAGVKRLLGIANWLLGRRHEGPVERHPEGVPMEPGGVP